MQYDSTYYKIKDESDEVKYETEMLFIKKILIFIQGKMRYF
jgi:hypothetical protein